VNDWPVAKRDLAAAAYPSPNAIYDQPAGALVGLIEYRRISGNATASFLDGALNNTTSLSVVHSYAVSIRGADKKPMFYVGGILGQ
jgi:hypothetical protein